MKKILFVHLPLFFIFHPICAMSERIKHLPPLSFLPTIAPKNKTVHILRKKLCADETRPEKVSPSIIVVKREKKGQRKGICYNVAMKRCLNLTKKELASLKIVGCEDWYKNLHVLSRYFYQTNMPQENTLAVYLKNKRIEHFAVANADGTFRSKLGIETGIYDHPLWLVPEYYGSKVVFLNLKETFKSIKGKKNLIKKLRTTASHSKKIKADILQTHEMIAICVIDNKPQNLLSLLRLYPYANIRMLYKGNTLLQYASDKKYHEIIKILERYDT